MGQKGLSQAKKEDEIEIPQSSVGSKTDPVNAQNNVPSKRPPLPPTPNEQSGKPPPPPPVPIGKFNFELHPASKPRPPHPVQRLNRKKPCSEEEIPTPMTPLFFKRNKGAEEDVFDVVFGDPASEVSNEKNYGTLPLDVCEIKSVSQTCKVFNTVARSNFFWNCYYRCFFREEESINFERIEYEDKIRSEWSRGDFNEYFSDSDSSGWSEDEEEDWGYTPKEKKKEEVPKKKKIVKRKPKREGKEEMNWKKQFLKRYFDRNDHFYRRRYESTMNLGDQLSPDHPRFKIRMALVGYKMNEKMKEFMFSFRKSYGSDSTIIEAEANHELTANSFTYEGRFGKFAVIDVETKIDDLDWKEFNDDYVDNCNYVLFCFSFASSASFQELCEKIKKENWVRDCREKAIFVGLDSEIDEKDREVKMGVVEEYLFDKGSARVGKFKFVEVSQKRGRNVVTAYGLGLDLGLQQYKKKKENARVLQDFLDRDRGYGAGGGRGGGMMMLMK